MLRLSGISLTAGGFSLSVPELSFSPGLTVLMGRSGSGKTTLLSIAAGLRKPDSGHVTIDGRETEGITPDAGIVFQYPERQLFAETLLSDVSFALRKRGEKLVEAENKARSLLLSLGFSERAMELSPFLLSGGERRLAAIAGVLVSNPQYLLLDEPLTGLDAASSERILSIIERLREGGRTIVMATHDAERAAYADRVVMMDKGMVVKNGAPDEIPLQTQAYLLSSFIDSRCKGFGKTVREDVLAERIERLLRGRTV